MPLIEYKDRHELPDENAVGIFNHMTKTGGTTLNNQLFVPHYGKHAIYSTAVYMIPVSYEPVNSPDEIRFINGHAARGVHELFSDRRKYFYFTFLRHPLKQMLSQVKIRVLRVNAESTPEDMNEMLKREIYNFPQNSIIEFFGNGDVGRAEKNLFEQCVFFGITEFFAESVHVLGDIFPFAREKKNILNQQVTPGNRMRMDGLAEEYFLEKNAKDIELYNKAAIEFKKRVPFDACGIKVETTEKSYNFTMCNMELKSDGKNFENHKQDAQNIVDSLRNMDAIPRNRVYTVFTRLGHSVEQWTAFYDAVRSHNLERYAFFEFLCAVELRKNDEMNDCGNRIFDVLDRIDGRNRIWAVVDLRLSMLRKISGLLPGFGKGTFFDRCNRWLSPLCAVPEWRGIALHGKAVLLEKCGELDAALPLAREAVGVFPDNLKFRSLVCRLLLASGCIAEAVDEARAELRGNPDSEWALRQLALALAAKGDPGEAKTALEKALRKNPCWKSGASALSSLGG